MKKILASGIFAILASSSTFAQTENFTGFSSTLGLKRSDVSYYADIFGTSYYSADIQAAYGIPLSKDVVLNIGASLGLGSSKVSDYSPITGEITSNRLKNPVSIYIEPGLLISNQTLLYSKISHESGRFASSFTDSGVTTNSSSTNQGLGLGFGIRTMLNNKIFLQFEMKKVTYNSGAENDFFYLDFGNRYTTTSGSIGIGYKF